MPPPPWTQTTTTATPADRAAHVQHQRIKLGMYRAPRVLPTPVAVVVTREMESWLETGYRFGDHGLMAELAELLLRLPDWRDPEHGR
jgi:hypothetical protein